MWKLFLISLILVIVLIFFIDVTSRVKMIVAPVFTSFCPK